MPLDADNTRRVLQKALLNEKQTRFLFDRFRERSEIKLKVLDIIQSKAEENSALDDLATYIEFMQKDLRTMMDIQEAMALNNLEFRQFTLGILKDIMDLHKMTDEEIQSIESQVEQVDKDVKGFKEHDDILRWI